MKLKVKVVTRDGNFPVGTVLDMLPRPGSQVERRHRGRR